MVARSTSTCSRLTPVTRDAPERIRTSDLVFRRHALYPAELRAPTLSDRGDEGSSSSDATAPAGGSLCMDRVGALTDSGLSALLDGRA